MGMSLAMEAPRARRAPTPCGGPARIMDIMAGWIALIVALTGLISAVGGIIALFRKVQAVHVLVNSQLTSMMSRVGQLTSTLHDAGLPIPEKPPDSDSPIP